VKSADSHNHCSCFWPILPNQPTKQTNKQKMNQRSIKIRVHLILPMFFLFTIHTHFIFGDHTTFENKYCERVLLMVSWSPTYKHICKCSILIISPLSCFFVWTLTFTNHQLIRSIKHSLQLTLLVMSFMVFLWQPYFFYFRSEEYKCWWSLFNAIKKSWHIQYSKKRQKTRYVYYHYSQITQYQEDQPQVLFQ
jgi:hypothetical protein